MDAHEAEQKERERSERRRREQRDQRSKGENGSGSTRKDQRAPRDRKKGAPLDVIDKLDVTGIYGSGCELLFLLCFSGCRSV